MNFKADFLSKSPFLLEDGEPGCKGGKCAAYSGRGSGPSGKPGGTKRKTGKRRGFGGKRASLEAFCRQYPNHPDCQKKPKESRNNSKKSSKKGNEEKEVIYTASEKPLTKKEGRCWPGYKPVPGKKAYSDGSCKPV